MILCLWQIAHENLLACVPAYAHAITCVSGKVIYVNQGRSGKIIYVDQIPFRSRKVMHLMRLSVEGHLCRERKKSDQEWSSEEL